MSNSYKTRSWNSWLKNLNQLNEEEEADHLGVFHVLGVLEIVLAFNPAISKVLIKKTKTLSGL
jgi:beta-catenin-like protein 1